MDHGRRSVLALLAALGAGCLDDSSPPDDDPGTVSPTVDSPTPGTPRTNGGPLDRLVAGNTAFALDLQRQLVSEAPAENLFVSPYSISTALAMTWAGAEGETESAMAEALDFQLDQDALHPAFESLVQAIEPDAFEETPTKPSGTTETTETTDAGGYDERARFQLRTANALWGQADFPFRESFLAELEDHYGAGMNGVDFASDPEVARETINDWVEARTEGKVEDLLPEGVIDTLTRLVLTNAIYFQAKWRYPFSEDATEPGAFTNLDGSTVEVPMMETTDKFPYGEVGDHQVVELPYSRREFGMVVVLPAEGQFEQFERDLDADLLARLFGALEAGGGTLTLPQFSVESATSLKDALSSLGMGVAFAEHQANFDGMVDPDALDDLPNLYVKDAIHKAFVSVDEKGTEAAAATGVVVNLESAPNYHFEMVVDRPFLFFIRHRETNAVLFAGRVVDGEAFRR